MYASLSYGPWVFPVRFKFSELVTRGYVLIRIIPVLCVVCVMCGNTNKIVKLFSFRSSQHIWSESMH